MALLRAVLVLGWIFMARTQPQPFTASSSSDAWPRLQTLRIDAFRDLFSAFGRNPLNSETTVRSYLSTWQVLKEELLLWSNLSPHTDAHEPPHWQEKTGPAASQWRQLLQHQDTKQPGSNTDPQGVFQAVGNDVSTFAASMDTGLIDRIMGFSAGFGADSDALLSDLPDTDVGRAGPGAVSSAIGAPAQVAALGGPTEMQPQQRLQPTLRIIGGVEAPTDRKYACSLRTTTSSSQDFLFCGCSLIAPTVVLTAAHCLASTDLRTPWVEIGRYFQQQPNDTDTNDYDRIKCTAGVPNRSWSQAVAQNDIALCFLESPSRFAPVKLANEGNTKITSGQKLTVMGWGATSEGGSQASALMTVDVATTDLNTCSAAYENKISGETQICAGVPQGGKDACQGDSGGALIIKGNSAADDVQVGIVSFGIGCGRPNVPGVYTDVRAYRDWVAQQMLSRNISYAPVTDSYQVSTNTVDQTTACACTTDGTSGSTFLGSNFAGCKQHSLSMGDNGYYCYTKGGSDCNAATASNSYPGAAWLECPPRVIKADSAASSTASTSTSQQKPGTTPGSTLLVSWIDQWLGGSVGKAAAPHIALPDSAASGTAPANSTEGNFQGGDVISRRIALPAIRG